MSLADIVPVLRSCQWTPDRDATVRLHYQKHCPRCNQVKSAREFAKKKDGRLLQSWCKACSSANNSERYRARKN